MTNLRMTAALAAAILACPASAGEQVLYAGAPEWVIDAPFDAAVAEGEDWVLYDRQIRLEDGVVTRFTDLAYDIRDTQALQRHGTLQFRWLPDKGDLTLHRLQLIRDGETIDLLQQDIEPEILRRERDLERRSVDGQLTAVITVPGMQVGDILRLSSSVTVKDQGLAGEMQASSTATAKPARIGFGRLRYSWPDDEEIKWGSIGQVELPSLEAIGDDKVLDLALPIARPKKMPEDAPGRFTVDPIIQVGSFADWREVSSVMAQHFGTEGLIDPAGPIAEQIAAIAGSTDNPLQRTAMALEVVQDQISYLANGMDGGNYLPQMPAETWDKRFGDCKAKSLLLLAMLREMGIESEAVLVDIDAGDAVAISQPLPGAFDHMIVRATIDGVDYWLDGTAAGIRIDTMYEVPAFHWALPLRKEGSELMAMEQRWPKAPDRVMRVTYDLSGGPDFPAIYDIEVDLRGSMAANIRGIASETDELRVLRHGIKYFSELVGGLTLEADYDYDSATGIATIKARGMLFDLFAFENDIATMSLGGETVGWEFEPDRARRSWREIPYAVGGPYTVRSEATYLLPKSDGPAEVSGRTELAEQVAGVKFDRMVTLEGSTLRMVDATSKVPAEIAPEAIPQEKLAMRRLSSGDPVLRIEQPLRMWELDDDAIAERIDPLINSSVGVLQIPESRAAMHNLHGVLRILARQYEQAIDHLDLAIEEGAEADHYSMRSAANLVLGRMDEAIEDAQQAYDLEPNLETAEQLATYLSFAGDPDYALDLLDELGLAGDEAIDMQQVWSELSGAAGREAEAWERVAALIEERPPDAWLHNSQCWLAGIWQYRLDEAMEHCDKAVQLSNHAAATVDSRALLHYRKGRFDAALLDIEEALRKSPSLAASRYLRGIIRLEQGEQAGALDIIEAKRSDPFIERQFEQYGIKPS